MTNERKLTAVSHDALAAQTPLRFPPPMIEFAADGASFSYWWAMIEFAFDVNDPRSFPPLPTGTFDTKELGTLERYATKAKDLASSTIMNASDEVKISIGEGGTTEEIETTSSPVDATTGFAAIFRQFYANDEEASFNVVQGILMRQAKTLSDPDADARVEELRRWGKAIGKSRSQSVEKSGLLKLIELGEMPPLAPEELEQYPDPETPEKLISTYFYGEHLHWSSKGGHAETLTDRGESPFDDAWFRMAFLRAAVGLAHLYLGYAVLVRQAAQLS